jgi:hypothetical protein
VIGSLTELGESKTKMPIAFYGLSAAEISANARIEVSVIDVNTSKTVLDFSEEGSASSSSMTFMGMDTGKSDGVKERALANAVSRVAFEIRGKIGQEYSSVTSERGNGFVIDIGEELGSRRGNLYLAYADGRAIYNPDGTQIGNEKMPLAVLKVKEANASSSVCEVTSPSKKELVARGDKVEPISGNDEGQAQPAPRHFREFAYPLRFVSL